MVALDEDGRRHHARRWSPGAEFHRLWGAKRGAARSPTRERAAGDDPYFPPVGGFRFGMFSVAPASCGDAPGRLRRRRGVRRDGAEASRSRRRTWSPTRRACTRPRRSTSRSCSKGRCGSSSTMARRCTCSVGDCVVQNGTRHAWRNHGSVPARLAVFLDRRAPLERLGIATALAFDGAHRSGLPIQPDRARRGADAGARSAAVVARDGTRGAAARAV